MLPQIRRFHANSPSTESRPKQKKRALEQLRNIYIYSQGHSEIMEKCQEQGVSFNQAGYRTM